jgi:hypothetical protein
MINKVYNTTLNLKKKYIFQTLGTYMLLHMYISAFAPRHSTTVGIVLPNCDLCWLVMSESTLAAHLYLGCA